MKFTNKVMPFVALLCLSLIYVACGDDDGGSDGEMDVIVGCLDEQAQNYNPEATEDDGSCVYDRDAFIGQYLGEFTCDDAILAPILNNDSLQFEVKIPVDDTDKSRVFFSLLVNGFSIDLESTIDGDVLTMLDTVTGLIIPDVEIPLIGTIDLTADVIGSGMAMVDGDDIEGALDLQLLITEPSIPGFDEFSDNCILVGTRN